MKIFLLLTAFFAASLMEAQNSLLLNGVESSKYFNPSIVLKKNKKQKFITGSRLLTWGSLMVAGTLWGAREAYHADPTVFEKKFGVGPTSFLGSKAWLRNYHNLAVDQGHKIELFNTFRDYWHFSGATSRLIYVGSAFKLGYGIHKQGWKRILVETGVGLLLSVTTAKLTYDYLRN